MQHWEVLLYKDAKNAAVYVKATFESPREAWDFYEDSKVLKGYKRTVFHVQSTTEMEKLTSRKQALASRGKGRAL